MLHKCSRQLVHPLATMLPAAYLQNGGQKKPWPLLEKFFSLMEVLTQYLVPCTNHKHKSQIKAV